MITLFRHFHSETKANRMGGGESIIVQEKLSQTEKPPEFSNFLHEKLVLQQHWEGGGAQAPSAHMPRF